jgi:hypothetical protein
MLDVALDRGPEGRIDDGQVRPPDGIDHRWCDAAHANTAIRRRSSMYSMVPSRQEARVPVVVAATARAVRDVRCRGA